MRMRDGGRKRDTANKVVTGGCVTKEVPARRLEQINVQ
jgi:hypothetical protein